MPKLQELSLLDWQLFALLVLASGIYVGVNGGLRWIAEKVRSIINKLRRKKVE